LPNVKENKPILINNISFSIPKLNVREYNTKYIFGKYLEGRIEQYILSHIVICAKCKIFYLKPTKVSDYKREVCEDQKTVCSLHGCSAR
jgi:hypothetical protein